MTKKGVFCYDKRAFLMKYKGVRYVPKYKIRATSTAAEISMCFVALPLLSLAHKAFSPWFRWRGKADPPAWPA